jgi:uncharacterized protein (TIGR03437 family)
VISWFSLHANRCFSFLAAIALFASGLSAQALFDKPVKVFGDPNFIGTAANPLAFDSYGPNVIQGRELSQPLAIAIDNSIAPPIVYIADTANNRILGYQYATQLVAGSVADIVLGQSNQFSNLIQGPPAGSLSTGLNHPTGIAVDSGGNLYVADSGNNRILRYAKPFAQQAGYQFPNLIIGQTSFSGYTGNAGGVSSSTLLLTNGSSFVPKTGLAFDAAGNLWVTDTGNNRVLRFPVAVLSANQNGPSADLAVGQADLVSSVAATSQVAKNGLSHPTSVAFDSAGRMLVADQLQRVLVYPAGIGANASAIRILGSASGQTGLPPVNNVTVGDALGVAVAGTSILVADVVNNRVMVFGSVDSWPAEATVFSPTATAVIGQTDFSGAKANQGNGDASASTLNQPAEFGVGNNELYIADSANNRVLVYPNAVNALVTTATRVIGQLDFPYYGLNLVEGKEFGVTGGSGFISGSAILDYSATPPHLYVADTLNNRVLGFNNFNTMQNGQAADLVIGQPDLFRTMVNYPTNNASTPNAQGLNQPSALTVDSAGNLYVADSLNSRILRFPTPFSPPSGTTTPETADLVLGQTSFTSIVTDTTSQTLRTPAGLAFTKDGANASVAGAGWLVASDVSQNRVLLFQKPFSVGMSASVVLGQANFTSATASSTASGLSAPRGVAVDPQDRVLVADTGNVRVQVFGTAAGLANGAGASFSLTSGLRQPDSIGMASSGEFWVADASQNDLLHFPDIDQLPVDNYAPDASQPAVSPRSAFVDEFNNLLVADGINRILFFAPQLAVVNAANYISGRALAPGTFAAIFPQVSTNIIANGTDSAATFPLPPVLADTQVLVNGTPSALFYVSQGQINFPLSLGLPTGGTVDVQVIRQSTGQIYGGAEVPMATASPGLFTTGGTGTGPAVSVNAIDNTVNSPTNPVVPGQYLTLYATGQGPVQGAPPDGEPATGPVPTALNPQVLLGGVYIPSSSIQYSGLAPYLVGVWQINIQIPATAQTGNYVPIQILMNSIPSSNPANPAQIATTVSIK